MAANAADTVKIHYTGKLSDGNIFDSSADREPLEFTLGQGTVLAGLESAIIGMEKGDTKTVTLASADAYGDRKTELIFEVQRDSMPDDVELEIGQQLEIQQENGESFRVNIVQLDDSTITLDANHPLADEDLVFEIELVDIQASA